MESYLKIDYFQIEGLFLGPLPNKSNSRKIIRRGKHFQLIKSKEALAYEKSFIKIFTLMKGASTLIPFSGCTTAQEYKESEQGLGLWADVYQQDLKRDLDCELLCDCLEKAGLIENDRGIWEKKYRRFLDKENPRVEFKIMRIDLPCE